MALRIAIRTYVCYALFMETQMTQELRDAIIAAADQRSTGIPTLTETAYGFQLTIVGLNSDEPDEDGAEDDPSLRDEVERLIASQPDPDAYPGNADYEVLWTDPEGNKTYIDLTRRSAPPAKQGYEEMMTTQTPTRPIRLTDGTVWHTERGAWHRITETMICHGMLYEPPTAQEWQAWRDAVRAAREADDAEAPETWETMLDIGAHLGALLAHPTSERYQLYMSYHDAAADCGGYADHREICARA